MNLADCYRLLGLSDGASRSEIKASYRRLARQCHPDVNVGDQLAQTKFIELTQAYKLLLNVVKPLATTPSAEDSQTVTVTKKPPTKPPTIPPLSEIEYQLKWTSYERLQQLLKEQRFARAIALVEGLAQRIPHDPEVRQWQAITYQCWGRYLVKDGQLNKARIYLKKALKTDPHNRSLWAEVERDFRRMEQMVY
ncbi:J domain-containing protein [Coleofasciculus sp. G2-EDA-02]|uniref:J domain-containing protein n=1 Tax=Coleofasciculus sp. G2-EDA-02 TaxID=3069529 RepID=UPI0032F117B4